MGTGNSWYTAVMPFFSTPSHIVQYRVSSQSPLAIAPFYVSTWEEYHTGVLQLGFINGPTEGILSATAILLASAVLTPFIWMQPLHVSVPAIASYFPVYVTLADVLCCIMGLLVIFVQIPQRYELTFRLPQILTSRNTALGLCTRTMPNRTSHLPRRLLVSSRSLLFISRISDGSPRLAPLLARTILSRSSSPWASRLVATPYGT